MKPYLFVVVFALIGTLPCKAFPSPSLKHAIANAALDEQDRLVMEKLSPRTLDRMDRNEPLTINDVIKLSQGGVSDDAIIRYMKESQSGYQLTQTQVRRLQDAGVSQRVINTMTNFQ